MTQTTRHWHEADWYDRPVREEEWTKHDRQLSRDIALDPDYPTWIRVAHYAYSKVEKNGVAYSPAVGELSKLLGIPSKNVKAYAIDKAVAKGLLAEGSKARLLILPEVVRYGHG